MITLFKEKHILLGVTGSIAAYKVAELASSLTQAGALVDVILTPAAEKFCTALTFQSVTGRKVYTDADLWGGQAHVLHVGLGHSSDLLVIAPATANTLGKMAHGLADNLLTITALAARCPILVAPAMDSGMYTHVATQENVRILAGRGVEFAGPGEGRMASGLVGKGRMLEPEEILGNIRLVLGRNGPLKGKQVVVTAGGTQEAIDPVRFISNRSSGKQGYTLAQAAIDCGGQVTLIHAPTSLKTPIGAKEVHVTTAEEMHQAVLGACPNTDLLLMAAAVADFRPIQSTDQKLKKQNGVPEIVLESTVDILGSLGEEKLKGKRPRVVVGFAAESQHLLENASEKLTSKRLDMVVANDISAVDAGFGVDTNRVSLIFANGNAESLPLMSKDEVAEVIIEKVAAVLNVL